MWKAVVLVVCLLVAGIHGMEGPSYGVKLCGREFIRAVIFTCGGSRWKRSLGSKGEPYCFVVSLWTLRSIYFSCSLHLQKTKNVVPRLCCIVQCLMGHLFPCFTYVTFIYICITCFFVFMVLSILLKALVNVSKELSLLYTKL